MVTGGQGPGSPLLLMAAKSHRCVRVSLREPRLSGPTHTHTDLKKLFKRPEKREDVDPARKPLAQRISFRLLLCP